MINGIGYKKTLSVVLPVYNGEHWISETTLAVLDSIYKSNWILNEFIFVNDGSTDRTEDILIDLAKRFPDKNLKVLNQVNLGRYRARANGIEISSGEYILLIDSRVRISADSLSNAFILTDKYDALTSHVEYASTNRLFGMFWSAAEVIFWNLYWKKPCLHILAEETFDLLPKGTTCFLSKRKLLIDAMERFTPAVVDIKKSSDDTELIRNMVKLGIVAITPKFSATYYARTNFQETMKHAYYRGVMFADGHVLRKSKLLFKLLKFITLSASTILLFFFTIGNLTSAIFTFIVANLLLIAKFPRLKWKRLMSLNLFFLPFFISWIMGVSKGVRERNELVR